VQTNRCEGYMGDGVHGVFIINYAVSYLSNLIVVELNISALFVFLQFLILT
jgi:hypothetical protein